MGELCRILAAAHARATRPAILHSPGAAAVGGAAGEEGAAAGGGGGQAAEGAGAESKYVARKLVLETSAIAAAGLKRALGLGDMLLGFMLQEPEVAIECEVLRHGTWEDKDNFYYIQKGRAQEWEHIPAHVKAEIRKGAYHGGVLNEGDYDAGHAGWTLDDFVAHPHSVLGVWMFVDACQSAASPPRACAYMYVCLALCCGSPRCLGVWMHANLQRRHVLVRRRYTCEHVCDA